MAQAVRPGPDRSANDPPIRSISLRATPSPTLLPSALGGTPTPSSSTDTDPTMPVRPKAHDDPAAARRGEGVLRRFGHQFIHHDADGRAGVNAQDHGAVVGFKGEVDALRCEIVEVARAAAERPEVVAQVRAVA